VVIETVKPEQMTVKDTAVDDYLLQLNRYSSDRTSAEQ
jgi:hypothetical protein